MLGHSALAEQGIAGTAAGSAVPTFVLSVSSSHATGVLHLTATFQNGGTASASNTFSIVSGPATTLTNYVKTDATHATFDITQTAVSGVAIVISESGTSTTANIGTDAVVPAAPTSVVAVDNHDDTVTVTFVAPTDNGGAAITSYVLTWGDGHQTTGSASPLTVAVTNRAAYTGAVHAVNSVGIGADGTSNSVTPVATAHDYYLSALGSDSNTGRDTSHPWLTPAKILTHVMARGDTYHFRGGDTFTTQLLLNDEDTGSNIANLITFTSYGTGKAILSNITGTGHPIECRDSGGLWVNNVLVQGTGVRKVDGTQNGIYFSQSKVGTVKNLENCLVTDCEVTKCKNGIAMFVWDLPGGGNMDYLSPVIEDNYIHNVWEWGIATGYYIDTGSPDNTTDTDRLVNLIVRGNNLNTIDDPGQTSTPGEGALAILINMCQNALIEYNLIDTVSIHQFGGGGVILIQDAGALVQHNEIKNCFVSAVGGDGSALDIDKVCNGCIMQYNYCHSCDGPGALFFESTIGFHVANPTIPTSTNNTYRYNVFQNCGRTVSGDLSFYGDRISNSYVYNNTFAHTHAATGNDCIVFADTVVSNLSGILISNNIMLGSTAAVRMTVTSTGTNVSVSSMIFENNCYYVGGGNPTFRYVGTNYASVAAWGRDSTPITADPQLSDPFTVVAFNDPTVIAGLTKIRPAAAAPVIRTGLDLTASPYSLLVGSRNYAGRSTIGVPADVGAVGLPFIPAWAARSNQLVGAGVA